MTTIRERTAASVSFRGNFLHPTMEAMCYDLETLLGLMDELVAELSGLEEPETLALVKRIRELVG